jgi:hypothetical protein
LNVAANCYRLERIGLDGKASALPDLHIAGHRHRPRKNAGGAGRDDEVAVDRPAGNGRSAGCVSGTGGRHGAGQNPKGRERRDGEAGQKSPRRCGAAAVTIVAIHITFLPTYSGNISQTAGFCFL